MLHARWLGLLMVASMSSGCQTLGRPNWCNPGSASYQLSEARRYDPFPDPYIAPPILGGRPLGFRLPREEPDVTKQPMFVPLAY